MRKQRLSKTDRRLLKNIAKRVSAYIEQDNQTRVAEAAGIARSTLREIAAGKSNVRIGSLSRIARAMGYGSLWAFLTGMEL